MQGPPLPVGPVPDLLQQHLPIASKSDFPLRYALDIICAVRATGAGPQLVGFLLWPGPMSNVWRGCDVFATVRSAHPVGCVVRPRGDSSSTGRGHIRRPEPTYRVSACGGDSCGPETVEAV